MNLDTLHLEQFKNYRNLTLDFNHRITSLVGVNGSGKTNVIDSIYYLGYTKSAFGSGDYQNILHGENHFLIKGNFHSDSKKFEVKAYLERNQKKVIRFDDLDYEKLSDHIGKILLVISTPYDGDIIRGPGEVRRKWVDSCISLVDKTYLETLIRFQKTLKQRNSLLRQANGRLSSPQVSLLDTYDAQVIEYSGSLSLVRQKFIEQFIPFFHSNVSSLVKDLEKCDIKYESDVLESEFEKNFSQAREKDILMQRTTMGGHKDDFVFHMDGYPIKRFGSQGQQKTFLIALRLAQFDYLTYRESVKPILLLDDIFDKLDDRRIKNLVATLKDENRFGQVVITDARKERTESFFRDYKHLEIVEIQDGKLK